MFEFKEPSLDFDGVTLAEREFAKKYTAIRKIIVKGEPDAHTAWLVVGGQRFCVSPQYHDTPEEASWQCWMLAKALFAFSAESVT